MAVAALAGYVLNAIHIKHWLFPMKSVSMWDLVVLLVLVFFCVLLLTEVCVILLADTCPHHSTVCVRAQPAPSAESTTVQTR